MAVENTPGQCKAHTKLGYRCKNRAKEGLDGYCTRHHKTISDKPEVVVATHSPPTKSLFKLVVPENKLHPSFKLLRTAAHYEPARRMLDDVYQEFKDLDGNFLEQFQSAGFDSRFFELYLFAYFSRSGFEIDLSNASPDFLVKQNGVTVAIEATTVNPSTSGVIKELGRTLKDVPEQQMDDFFNNELPIRFGGPLFSKLKKKYWELDQCRGLPFVIAIQAFHETDAQMISDGSLINYLYGSKDAASWNNDGSLKIDRHNIKSHRLGSKEIPSNFFMQPDTENISAVIFTNSGTAAKFSRMGFQHGFGCDIVDMSREGFWFNPDPSAMDPTFMTYNLDNPPFVEPWGQGLVVFHNPNCKHPLPRDFFIHSVQGHIKNGQFIAEHSDWHPIMTKTRTLYLGPDKAELRRLPWRQSSRVTIGAIPKQEFMTLCPYSLSEPNPIAEEQGWYIDETMSFLGVVALDKSDNDWTWIVLARDENFVFRCIDMQSSLPSRDQARVEVQLKIAELLASSRRIFSVGNRNVE